MNNKFIDKYGQRIGVSSSPKKFSFGLMPSIYEPPNAGRFRSRYYIEQDSETGINQYNRTLLLRFSREMTSQMPFIYSGIKCLSTFAVGAEYKPRYIGNNDVFGKEAISWLKEIYYPNCSLRGPNQDFQSVITLLGETVDVDGDILVVFNKNGKFQLIPSHRIRSLGSSPFDPATNTNPIPGPVAGTVVSDGVVYKEKTAEPIGYIVQNAQNLVNSSFNLSGQYSSTFISSKNSRLVYMPRFPDRGRGIPTISSGILQAMSLEEVEAYLVEKLKIQSMYATVEHTPEGEGPLEEEEAYKRAATFEQQLGGLGPITQPWMNASKGLRVVNNPSIKYVSASPGVDIKFPAASITEKETSDFITRLEQHVLMTLGVPHVLIFSPEDVSGKMNNSQIEIFNGAILKRQQMLDNIGSLIIGQALAKAIEDKELPSNENEILTNCFEFSHPTPFSVDDIKVRQTDLSDYEAGTKTLEYLTRRDNTTPEKLIEQREKESILFFESAQRIATKTNVDVNVVIQSLRNELKQKTPPSFGGGDENNFTEKE